MLTKMLQFNLPYPPTINNYYKKWQNRIVISAQGRAYRQLLRATLWQCIGKAEKWDGMPMDGDLMVEIIIYPPDKRKRDMDNIKKALFDSLQYAGLFSDDYQICDDHTIRINKIVKGGLIDFRIMSAKTYARTICDRPMTDFLSGFSL
jgi:crossover junction endodeoxyribonuclease RusA